MSYSVITRLGHKIEFDIDKIARAVELAYQSTSSADQYTDDELENYHDYIRLLAELDWPAYMNGDSAFHELVLAAYKTNGVQGVENELYKYYGALYLKTLEEQMCNSVVINGDRLPLFHEAFLLYQLGYYYGAVAILITQLIGITADIEKYLKKNASSFDPTTIQLIHSRYGFNSTNDTSRVMTAVLEGKSLNDVQGEYNYLLGYLRCKIFRSNIPKAQRKEELSKHPNRQYVCHGVQLNYGTKEHALKVILCIDALTWVAEVISDNITKNNTN